MPLENQIRREDIGYKLSKALEIRGQGTPTLTLDQVVVPVVLVEDLSLGNEQDYAIHRWCRGRTASGAGAQFGKASFNNHADSGILVKVYQVDIFHDATAATGGEVGMSIESSSAGGTQIINTKEFTDSRLSFGSGGGALPSRLPSVDIRTDNSGGIGVHPLRPFVPDPHQGHFHTNLGGWVLRPGTRLHFEALDLAIVYTVHVEWTETNI
jgi:hypothetical protein